MWWNVELQSVYLGLLLKDIVQKPMLQTASLDVVLIHVMESSISFLWSIITQTIMYYIQSYYLVTV